MQCLAGLLYEHERREILFGLGRILLRKRFVQREETAAPARMDQSTALMPANRAAEARARPDRAMRDRRAAAIPPAAGRRNTASTAAVRHRACSGGEAPSGTKHVLAAGNHGRIKLLEWFQPSRQAKSNERYIREESGSGGIDCPAAGRALQCFPRARERHPSRAGDCIILDYGAGAALEPCGVPACSLVELIFGFRRCASRSLRPS